MQKFKIGDKVRIVNYGHSTYFSKSNYYELSKGINQTTIPVETYLMWGKKMTDEEINKIEGSYKPENIITETDDLWCCDMSPELVGKEGIIEGSYYDLCGKETDLPEIKLRKQREYSIIGIPEKCAWFYEDQIELI